MGRKRPKDGRLPRETRAGLCAYDKMPDGITCTYNYRILGWVPIDDLVGITGMTFKANSTKYPDFYSFCVDEGVEFNAMTEGVWESGIDFWKNPQDSTANAARAKKAGGLVCGSRCGGKTLTQVTAADLARFKPLPTIAELTTRNPKCYENDPKCSASSAAYGCKRSLYGQICEVCTSSGEGCEKAPSSFTFPKLAKSTSPAPPLLLSVASSWRMTNIYITVPVENRL